MVGHHDEGAAEAFEMLHAKRRHSHQSPDQWLKQTALRNEPRTLRAAATYNGSGWTSGLA